MSSIKPQPGYAEMSSAEREDERDLLREPLSLGEVRALERRLRAMLADLERGVVGTEELALVPSGAERYPSDDEPLEETSLAAELAVLEQEQRIEEAVVAALERIATDTYGICASCGEWISRGRLQVVPFTGACSGCAARAYERDSRS